MAVIGFILPLVLSVGIGAALLGGVSSLRSCGSGMAEANLLADLVQEEAQRADSLQIAAEGAAAAQAESNAKLRAAHDEVARVNARIANLVEAGEGTTCPADCELPSLD